MKIKNRLKAMEFISSAKDLVAAKRRVDVVNKINTETKKELGVWCIEEGKKTFRIINNFYNNRTGHFELLSAKIKK